MRFSVEHSDHPLLHPHPPPPPAQLPSNSPPPPLGTKEDFNTCCSSSQWTAPQRPSDPSHHLTNWQKPQLTGNPSLHRQHLDQVQKWDRGRNQVLSGLSLKKAAAQTDTFFPPYISGYCKPKPTQWKKTWMKGRLKKVRMPFLACLGKWIWRGCIMSVSRVPLQRQLHKC